jgi:NhaA family Na+:H+ antiporter
VAIIDDLGAILIIALLYSSDLSLPFHGAALVCTIALFVLNRSGVTRYAPYMLVGAVLWVCVLKSGVHATLAGVVLAMAIPIRSKSEPGRSPLRELEHALHPWVAYMIMPLFAFANAGVPLAGFRLADLAKPLTLGITLGLFLGKQLGLFVAARLAVALRLADKPEGTSWLQVYGAGLLAGIGFTMSLFIGTLAYPDVDHAASVRIGVLSGSLLSGICGYLVLRMARPAQRG